MKEFLLYSKRCWIDNSFKEATLYIKEGSIFDVFFSKRESPNTLFLDYGNLIVIPGIIDAHVHINEPGRENREDIDTANKAAASGGITTLLKMPLNASPVTTTTNAFNIKKQ